MMRVLLALAFAASLGACADDAPPAEVAAASDAAAVAVDPVAVPDSTDTDQADATPARPGNTNIFADPVTGEDIDIGDPCAYLGADLLASAIPGARDFTPVRTEQFGQRTCAATLTRDGEPYTVSVGMQDAAFTREGFEAMIAQKRKVTAAVQAMGDLEAVRGLGDLAYANDGIGGNISVLIGRRLWTVSVTDARARNDAAASTAVARVMLVAR